MNENDLRAKLTEALSDENLQDLPPVLAQHWEAVECLGHNTQGETLLVRNRQDGGQAVAKVFSDGQPESRIMDELKQLQHPGLPRILEIHHVGKQNYILREYVEGHTLAELAAEKQYTEAETVAIAQKLCDILTVLHEHVPPLIHRDVKPENILLRPDGSPVLIDFGIARLQANSAEADTRVMGTQWFAPPQQYGFHQTDARSDLYALGVVLCWMVTGTVQVDEGLKKMKNPKLIRVIRKCTQFAPEKRYKSAAEVKKALKGNCLVQVVPAILLAVMLVFAGWMLFGRSTAQQMMQFREPMIEAAVRRQLNMAEGTPLQQEDLNAVTGLYIFADTIAADEDGFYAGASTWYSDSSREHGAISSLEDLRMMPNLTHVMIAAQQITDLSPLAGLPLVKVEFKHNGITDISPLRGMEKLSSVGLNDNPMEDLSPLQTLPQLRFLDLCDANLYAPAVLDGLGNLEFLDLSNRTESWQHIGQRGVRQLKLGWTGLDSLQWLNGVTGLESLEIEHTSVTDLSGIEQHVDITYLRISGCAINDLTPVLQLPELQTLVITPDMEAAVQALGEVSFVVNVEN